MRCMRIEASAAVLSSTLRIFIWPRSYALRIDSIRLCEVLPKGSSVMLSVRLVDFFDFGSDLYRAAAPSVVIATYVHHAAVAKSGYSSKGSLRTQAIEASSSSLKL